MKLQDSTFSTGVTFPIPGSLSTTRDILIDSPLLYGCSDWESTATTLLAPPDPFIYTVFATGFVNFWKYLRQGETILESSVALWKFQQFGAPEPYEGDNIYTGGRALLPVLVDFFPPSGYNGRGYFNRPIFEGLNLSEMQPAYSLFFKGWIYTTLNGVDSNRAIYVDFQIEGEITSSTAEEVISNSENCTVPLIGDPVAYIPEDCYEWTIHNTSPFPIRWNGLHGNGVTIIGGIIQPGQYAKSLGNGGTYPVAREFSLSAMGNPTYGGGVITYTGSAVTCPIL